MSKRAAAKIVPQMSPEHRLEVEAWAIVETWRSAWSEHATRLAFAAQDEADAAE